MSESKDTKDIKDTKDTKDGAERKLSTDDTQKKLDAVLLVTKIATTAEEATLIKKLLLEDLSKIKEIEEAFEKNPKISKLARTQDRTGKARKKQNSSEEYANTDLEKKLNLNFSVVRSFDDKSGKYRICILLEGQGLQKYDSTGKKIKKLEKVGKELGSGSFGLVKLALPIDTLKIGAVKITDFFSPNFPTNLEQKKKIWEDTKRDHQIASELNRTIGEAESKSKHYSFMEFFPGMELFNLLASPSLIKKMTLIEKLNMAFNAAASLKGIHDRGWLHCDVKPENAIYDPDTLDVTIIDFGLSLKATQTKDKNQEDILIAKSNSVRGTTSYLDPNIMKKDPKTSEHSYTTKSDIYSLGLVFLLLFFFHGETPTEWYIEEIKKCIDFINNNRGNPNATLYKNINTGAVIPPHSIRTVTRNQRLYIADPRIVDQAGRLLNTIQLTTPRKELEAIRQRKLNEVKEFYEANGSYEEISRDKAIYDISSLVTFMITEEEENRPNFAEIFNILAEVFIERIQRSDLSQIKHPLNTPLLNYIIRDPNLMTPGFSEFLRKNAQYFKIEKPALLTRFETKYPEETKKENAQPSVEQQSSTETKIEPQKPS